MKKKTVFQTLWKIEMLAVVLVFLAACAAPTPTAAPTATQAPTATPIPTATPTSLPEMPAGPFVWSGETRPLLMAHYMPWYQSAAVSGQWGWHWTMNHFTPSKSADGIWSNFASHFTPLTGPYDSSDEVVLEYQVQLMKLSGIDGVIVDWYGIESFWDYGTINASTNKLFEVIKKAGLKFVVCYEDATVKNMVENGRIKEEDAIAHGQKVMAYLQETWFGDEAYLKVDGRPLLFNFGPQYFKTSADWQSLFSGLEPKPLFVNLDNPLKGGADASFPWPPMWASKSGVLSHNDLLSYLTDFYDASENWKVQVGGAFPGFDDIYKEAGVSAGYGFLDALDGKTFRFTLQHALDQNPDLVQLITWNDYGEGTIIEPTVEFEYRYLEMVQEARAVTDSSFSYTSDDLRLPLRLYQMRAEHAADANVLAELDKASEALLNGDAAAATAILDALP
jgi:hypothetical protein